MNRMYLVLGDWSDDGHGKTEKKLYGVNKTVLEVQEAYKASCRLTGFSFNLGEDHTGVTGRSYEESAAHQIAVRYKQDTLSKEVYLMFKEHGYDFSNWDVSDLEYIYIEENFEDLWWFFVKLSLLDVEYTPVEDTIPNINGYWDSNLNEQFAYGMY